MANEPGFEFMTALDDHVSAPAHAEGKALDVLKKSIEGVAGAEHKAGESHGFLAKMLERGKEGWHEFTGSLIPQIAVAELAAEAIKKLGESIVEGAKFAIEAAEFKENAVLAYEAVLGTAEEGEKTFKEIDKLANSVRMPAEKAHDLAQSLLIQGMENQEQLTSTITAISNLQRVGMQAGADRLQRIVETSLATGHVEISKKTLRGTGLHLEDLIGDIATRLHESRERVKSELAAGKIDAQVGIAAITDAINNGHIGEIAQKKFDLTDALTIFKNEMRAMFQDVDVSPLKQALVDFVSIFDQGAASGRTMHDAVTFSLNEIIKWIGHAIETGTLMTLKFEMWGLEGYIALFPLIDVFVRIEHAIMGALDAINNLGNSSDGVFSRVYKAVSAAWNAPSNAHPLGPDVATPVVQRPVEQPVSAPTVVRPPAHAKGGLVAEPPPGEAFAAVKPGEMIVPSDFSFPQIDYEKLGGRGGPANSGGGGHRIDFTWTGDVVVHNGGDHQEIKQTVTETMADMFEQLAMELGG